MKTFERVYLNQYIAAERLRDDFKELFKLKRTPRGMADIAARALREAGASSEFLVSLRDQLPEFDTENGITGREFVL